MTAAAPTVAILGASGLIGNAVAVGLRRQGLAVMAIARRSTEAQAVDLGEAAVVAPVARLSREDLARLLGSADVIVNCIGVLQDAGGETTDDVHRGLTARLIAAIALIERPVLLVHLSIPGAPDDDRTGFSRTKREAERLIAGSALPYVILRPGFVIAPAAYGGSALIRALAALPFRLSAAEAGTPFAATDIADVVRTVAVVVNRWRSGQQNWDVTWEVMERKPSTVGDVVAAFRIRFGGPRPGVPLPSWLLTLCARAGDLAARLGWLPPVRSTALAELRRGVTGDPAPWSIATGIEPPPLREILAQHPATVQEAWFGRLYLLKPLVIGALAVFWIASGLIALVPSFAAASGILAAHGFSPALADAATVASSLLDIGIGLGIAFRRTCRVALVAGIAASILYMLGAAVLTPDLWIEPLGALVKTIPAVVLMLVALATLENR